MKIYSRPSSKFEKWYKELVIIFYNHQLNLSLIHVIYYYNRGYSPENAFYQLVK